MVGGNAASSKPRGLITPSSKQPFKIENPAGLGALAMTVSPPPVTALLMYVEPGQDYSSTF